MQDSYLILWAVIFSVTGLAFIVYGHRKKKSMLVYTGLLLCIYPFFMPNALSVILVGMVLVSFPYFY